MMISAWAFSCVAVIGNFHGLFFKFLEDEVWYQADFAIFFFPSAEVI